MKCCKESGEAAYFQIDYNDNVKIEDSLDGGYCEAEDCHSTSWLCHRLCLAGVSAEGWKEW